MQHERVARAAVIPVPDPRLGEKVCLVVARDPDGGVEPAALLAHLRDAGLSPHDLPEYFVEVDDLPLLPSGKVSKQDLSAWVREGRVTPVPAPSLPAR
jgi:acyl-CoA synthetase